MPREVFAAWPPPRSPREEAMPCPLCGTALAPGPEGQRCPSCGLEVVPAPLKCPACDVELVEVEGAPGAFRCPVCGGEFLPGPDEFDDAGPFSDWQDVYEEDLRQKEAIRRHGGGGRRKTGRFRGGKKVSAWRRPILATWDEKTQAGRKRRRAA